MAQVVLEPPVKAHSAALRPSGHYHIGVHPGAVSVDHEIGVEEGIGGLFIPCISILTKIIGLCKYVSMLYTTGGAYVRHAAVC